MNSWYGEMLLLFIVGAGAGIISAGLGLGGGILMVPAFEAFLPGMDLHTAKGTSLFLIVFISSLNTWRARRELPPHAFTLAAWLAAGSVIGGYASAWITGLLPEQVTIILFLLLLLAVAARTFLLREIPVPEDQVHKRPGIALLIGFIAGIFGGATGTGGGAVLIPLALMTGIVANARAVPLSNLVMIATSLAGTLANLQAAQTCDYPWTVGHVALAFVPLTLLGAQLGSELGLRLNRLLTLPRRRVAMGVLLLIIALRLGWRLVH